MSTHELAVSIELAGVTRAWGDVCALDDVDLVIPAGERVALIGPSGSGKSTLLSLVAGSLASSKGRVMVGGEALENMSLAALRRHRGRCGIIPQGSTLVSQLSVHHNMLTGLLPHWPWYRAAAAALFPQAFERERVRGWLWEMGLEKAQDKLSANLSGGEQQRVAVARALLPGPGLIVADEPTASLDPSNAATVAKLLVRPERDATVLISTHWVSLIADSVDRVIGLREGRVVLDMAPHDMNDADLSTLYQGSDERR